MRLYELNLKQLDLQIALPEKVKVILNEDKSSAWKKIQFSKKSRMTKRGKKTLPK